MQSNLHIGRVVRDIELQTYGSENKSRIYFSLAVPREQSKDVDFLNYVAFGKTAELIAEYGGKKGTTMAVKFVMNAVKTTNSAGESKTFQNNVVKEFKVLAKPQTENRSQTPAESDGFPTDADAHNAPQDDIDMTFMGPTSEVL